MIMLGTMATLAEQRKPSAKRNATLGDCTTCTAISGNGALTGIKVSFTRSARCEIRFTPSRAYIASCAVARGEIKRKIAGLLVAAGTNPTPISAISAFALSVFWRKTAGRGDSRIALVPNQHRIALGKKEVQLGRKRILPNWRQFQSNKKGVLFGRKEALFVSKRVWLIWKEVRLNKKKVLFDRR